MCAERLVAFFDLHEAVYLDRPSRFVVKCRLIENDQVVTAHLADPGRLREILTSDQTIWLRRAGGSHRQTEWSVVLAGNGKNKYTSLDTTLPNKVIQKALTLNLLDEFGDWSYSRSEYLLGNSRWDFLLERDQSKLLLEVKSVTLCENGVGLFPDAVTLRGKRHLAELAHFAKDPETEAAVLFVAQRADIDEIRPATHIDPAFSKELRRACENGVRLHGRRLRIDLDGISLDEPVPIYV